MYTDSHAHISNDQFADTIEEILLRAQAANVTTIVNMCTDIDSLKRGLELHRRYPWILNAAATTPNNAEREGEQVFPIISKHAHSNDFVAIGETGLDYYYQHSSHDVQQKFLKKYFRLALECKLPVIIHCRDAFDDLFDIADEEYIESPAALHCFTGTMNDARRVLDRGWYLSLSGIVTFKNSGSLRDIASFVPLGRLLIETDSPYLAPQSKRGKVNEPSFLPEIAKTIANIKGITIEEIAETTSKNAKHLFTIQ